MWLIGTPGGTSQICPGRRYQRQPCGGHPDARWPPPPHPPALRTSPHHHSNTPALRFRIHICVHAGSYFRDEKAVWLSGKQLDSPAGSQGVYLLFIVFQHIPRVLVVVAGNHGF